jgi:branched-chain amino acid aminotransferase
MAETAAAGATPAEIRDRSWMYFNGRVCRYAEATVPFMTHGFHYGTGVFEGIRAYWDEKREQLWAFRMPEHFERLRSNAKILKMALPHSTDQLCEITADLLKRNACRSDMYIRPLVYKSSEVIGVRLHGLPDGFGIYLSEMGNYVDIDSGLRCMVSSWRRIDDTMIPARSKCTGTYVNSALAKSEAEENGFDEAIFLTVDGHVCEGSAENIFIIRDGTFITPPPSDNILEGITRATLIQVIGEDLGYEVVQRSIDRTELYIADEVFMCGTGAQVSPVTEIDRRVVGDGEPGPMTMRLQSAYFDIVKANNAKYAAWLTPTY